jgi:hypothetical protein
VRKAAGPLYLVATFFATTVRPLCFELHDERTMGKKGESDMLTAGPRDRRTRKSKSKTKRARSTKRSEALWSKTSSNHQNLQPEEVDRLLASALRYWEAKRDLIDERIAAINGATAHS